MKLKIFILVSFFYHSFINAQDFKIFNFPNNIHKPCWVDKINWEKPNIIEIKKIKDSCNGNQEKNQLEKEREEPYENALKRFLNSSAVFILNNGDIKIDINKSSDHFIELVKTQNDYLQKKEQVGALKIENEALPNGIAKWTPIGPLTTHYNGAKRSWQANIYSIVISPSDPRILYCGAETGVIFKSIDKGLNWTSISDALPRDAISAIAVSPSNSNLVFASLGDIPLAVKSLDGGLTWANLPFSGGAINKLIINPKSGRLIAAAIKGIYYSDNDGNSWVKASTTINVDDQIYDIVFNPSNPLIVYAVSAVNISTTSDMVMLISNDGGQTFTKSTIPSNTYCKGARFGVSSANPNFAYCITLQNDVPKLLFSNNNGSTWSTKTLFTGTNLTGTGAVNGMSNGQGFYDLDIVVSPTNVNHIIVGTTSAYKSTDGGVNFNPLGGYNGSFLIHPDIQCMVAYGNDTYITTDGGVNYSPDFFSNVSTFEARNNGLSASDNWGFSQGWSEDIIVGGRYHNGNSALYEPYGLGNSLQIGGAEDATGHVFEIPGETGIVGFRDLGVMLKKLPISITSTARNSKYANTIWPSEVGYGQFSSKLMQDPNYANIVYVGNGKSLWKSENYGLSYSELKTFSSNVWRFDISRSNPNIFYLCTETGVFKSIDKGNNWTQLGLPVGINYRYYNADITVNPGNENEVWLCMSQGAANNKVLKSINGGIDWINYTGALLNNRSIAYIIAQGGTNGGVYAISNSSSSRVYYRDATMNEWIDYSGDLPYNFNAKCGGAIFYRDNKLRITGNRGTFESPLYSTSKPLSMPLADRKFVYCPKDTIIFRDHSILNYSGASWKWSFPGANYISSTSSREVKVTYPNTGNYSVGLTIIDAKGNTSSRFIDSLIFFKINNCEADSVPGKSLSLDFKKNFYSIGTANINSNNLTISCWFKPNGLQNSFAQLISHDPYPGSQYGFGLGFSFKGYVPNLNLCYTDNLVNYGNSTNAVADSTKWNHVALVYSPNSVIIYLNGVAYEAKKGPMPVINLSTSPFYINKDILNQGGDFKGEIDEIKIYNYALTQSEIREKMHLINNNSLIETGLLKYVQFNTIDSLSNLVYELIDKTSINLPNRNSLVNSSAPVGRGVSFRNNIISAGKHTFLGTGIEIYTSSKNGSIFPNGEIVVSKIKPVPSHLPDNKNSSSQDYYYIINNFGTNFNFSPIDSIRFNNLNINSSQSINYKLYKRTSFAYGNDNWGNSLSFGKNYSNTILSFLGSGINSFGQFVISSPIICNPQTSFIKASDTLLCFDKGTNIFLSENYNSTSFKIKWLKSFSYNGVYSEFAKDSIKIITGNLKATSYFKCQISCNNDTLITYTTPIIEIKVLQIPQPPSVSNLSVCVGSFNPTFQVSNTSGYTLRWYGTNATGGTASTSAPTVSSLVVGVTNYYVSQISAQGCESDRRVLVYKVNPLPVKPVISWSGVQFSTTATGVNYQWLLNGTSISGATASTHKPLNTGDFKLRVTDPNGCVNVSDSFKLVVTALANLVTTPVSNIATVYPNPALNKVVIEFATLPTINLNFQLVTPSGKVLSSKFGRNKVNVIDVSKVESGNYFIRVIGKKYDQTKKVLIQK